MYKKLSTFLLFLALAVTGLQAKDYNVKDFGAMGDGKTLDHHAINAAIDTCVAHGGGRIVLPAGTYLCGSIRLKSHVELHLMTGSKILAAPAKMKAYDEAEEWIGPAYQDGGHTYFKNSLIYAIGANDVSITGRGMIDGEGLTRRDTEKGGKLQGGNIGTGDKAIALKQCRNILIRDVTIYRGGHFGIILTGCELGTVDNVVIDTNRDGFDIDCCKYLTVSNCTFMYSSGLAFEEVDQGIMENVVVNNITMNHVHHYPIYITTGCRNRGPKERTTVSTGRDIMISNVVANDVDSLAGIIITGMPGEPLRNISLSNIRLQYRGGGSAELAKRQYREQGTNYPEPKFAKETPAFGLFARHVDNLEVDNVSFTTIKPDYRPAIMLEDVKNERFTQIKADVQKGSKLIVKKK